jgi:hypothetical protein
MSDEVKLYRYYLPSEKYEGWAEIVVGSNGFFAAVSDYGNYAFRWTHFGEGDFREFLLRLGGDYVRSKLDPSRVLDLAATKKACRIEVGRSYRHRNRPNGTMHFYDVQQALEALDGVCDEEDLQLWLASWSPNIGEEAWREVICEKPRPAIMAFVERTLPRLKDAIRAEMDMEKQQGEEDDLDVSAEIGAHLDAERSDHAETKARLADVEAERDRLRADLDMARTIDDWRAPR